MKDMVELFILQKGINQLIDGGNELRGLRLVSECSAIRG